MRYSETELLEVITRKRYDHAIISFRNNVSDIVLIYGNGNRITDVFIPKRYKTQELELAIKLR